MNGWSVLEKRKKLLEVRARASSLAKGEEAESICTEISSVEACAPEKKEDSTFCDDPSERFPLLRPEATTSLQNIVRICGIKDAVTCSQCGKIFEINELSSCAACNDSEETYCEECGFMDVHPCMRLKVGVPSASISPSWEHGDEKTFGYQCKRCREYKHGEKQCPLDFAKVDAAFRKRVDKNAVECTECFGYGHLPDHHEAREKQVESWRTPAQAPEATFVQQLAWKRERMLSNQQAEMRPTDERKAPVREQGSGLTQQLQDKFFRRSI